jgi:hypothetical protein
MGYSVGNFRHKNLVSGEFWCRHPHAKNPKFIDILTCCRHVVNMSPTFPAQKKSAHNEGNVENVMFKNSFSGDLKLKVAENVNKSSKSNSIGVNITGPFCNSETHKVTGLWFMEIMETRGCSNLNSSMATYQLYCLVIDKALLTLITATLMMTFTFAKMNSALKVYGGTDPAPHDKRIGPSPGFHLSIPVTKQMKRLVNKVYLKQLKSSSCR